MKDKELTPETKEEWLAFKYAWKKPLTIGFMSLAIIFVGIGFVVNDESLLIPMFASAFIAQYYFGKYKKQYLGRDSKY